MIEYRPFGGIIRLLVRRYIILPYREADATNWFIWTEPISATQLFEAIYLSYCVTSVSLSILVELQKQQ